MTPHFDCSAELTWTFEHSRAHKQKIKSLQRTGNNQRKLHPKTETLDNAVRLRVRAEMSIPCSFVTEVPEKTETCARKINATETPTESLVEG